jgi:hypothetical protein
MKFWRDIVNDLLCYITNEPSLSVMDFRMTSKSYTKISVQRLSSYIYSWDALCFLHSWFSNKMGNTCTVVVLEKDKIFTYVFLWMSDTVLRFVHLKLFLHFCYCSTYESTPVPNSKLNKIWLLPLRNGTFRVKTVCFVRHRLGVSCSALISSTPYWIGVTRIFLVCH